MHRERSDFFQLLSLVYDIGLIFVSFLIAYYIKTTWLPEQYQTLSHISDYDWVVVLFCAIVLVTQYLSGFYTFGRTMTFVDLGLGVGKSVSFTVMVLVFFLFTLKVQTISRLLILLFGGFSWLFLVLGRLLIKFISGRVRQRGVNLVNILICGSGPLAESVIQNIQRYPDLGYRIIGCVDVDPERVGKGVCGIQVIGTTDQLEEILNQRSIDEVFFAIPSHLIKNMDRLVYLCEEVGVQANVVWDLYKPAIAKTVVRDFLDVPVLTFTATPIRMGELMVKRLMDFTLSLIGMILLSPFLAIIALLVKLTSNGPVLFSQQRSGLNGRTFTMYKFRTMVKDAESQRSEMDHLNEMKGPVFKVHNDPRVTRIGHFLRKTSIDELPQLINILKGEMSLVGPRPPIPSEVKKYERWQRRRLSMKPGLTCFWQIKGRNTVEFDDWMKLDLRYIDNWSLKLDIKILLKTIPVVLLQKGAS